MTARMYTGIAARGIVWANLRAIAFTMFVLLIVALAIDLAAELDGIRGSQMTKEAGLASILPRYIMFRATDIVTRLFPLACLIGPFVAQLLRHQRMEDIILGAAGVSPRLTYSALLVVGLAAGGVQVAFEGWLRPAAVFAQVDLQQGSYARRFHRGDIGLRWFVDENRALRASVVRTDPPELRRIQLFEGISTESVDTITIAPLATLSQDTQSWVLHDATVWQSTENALLRPTEHKTLNLDFPVSAQSLRYFDIPGFYIPDTALRTIAAHAQSRAAADAKTAVVRRYAALFLPGIFVFLGATLAQAGFQGRQISAWRLLILGTIGYLSVVSIKVFWALGEFDRVSPVAASFVPLAAASALAIAMQLRITGFLRLPKMRS
nr:LptF/LptG family permease [uncultured Shimia sp.]